MEDEILDDEIEESELDETERVGEEKPDHDFLSIARDAHSQSQSFLEMALYGKWRKNYAMSQSEHPDGSKYLSEQYARRSRNFRGKTEASIRKNEAAMAVAMFSHEDVTSISAVNKDDELQSEAAKNLHLLVNERLENSISWFLISIGAYHEVMVTGDIVSEQWWEYEVDDDGNVTIDKPSIELYPPENVKISPFAKWTDPINSSPYVVIEIPMFIGDIKERMEIDWIPADDSTILAAKQQFNYNEVRSSREGDKQSAGKDSVSTSFTDFDLVYVHKNFIRIKGTDYFYYTLGTHGLLSEPIEVHDPQGSYPHLKKGQRPLVRGMASIEPHKVYHRSLVDRVEGSQVLINDLANLRLDNVKQVLNKRKYATRYAGIDYNALMQSFPGGVVMMDDINAVKPEDTPDVTGSSYQEQNVLNVDFDELAGSFSNASVATNRSLNETVGGMSMLQGNSNTLTEYQLRILVETWVEPVIKQIVDMVKFYEDDEVIQQVCGADVTSESIQIPVKTRVSVGFGSTDPQQKVQKLLFALSAIAQAAPKAAEKIKAIKLAQEIFGYLGFNDGKAFVDDTEEEDPMIAQLQEQVQQLQQIIATEQHKVNGQIELEKVKGRNNITGKLLESQANRQLRLVELAVERGIKVDEIQSRSGIDNQKLNLDLLKELNRQMDIKTRKDELSYKMNNPGVQGI